MQVFPFSVTPKDCPMEKRVVNPNATVLGSGGNKLIYGADASFPTGQYREHVTHDGDGAHSSGSYIEERASSYRPNLAKNYPSLKLTVVKFPEVPAHLTENSDEVVKDRIHFGLAMAMTLLSTFSEPPSAKNPVILRGFDPVEMGYIWTGLMIIGDKIPSMQFNHKAISVLGPSFSPDQEVGMIFRYSDESYHDRLFKPQQEYVDCLLRGVKIACADQVTAQKELQRADKLTTVITSNFKSNLQQTLDELRENQDKGPGVF